MSELKFNIEGMTCAACAARIQDGLAKSAGVDDVAVNFALKTGFVKGTIDPAAVEAIVYRLGYGAKFPKGRVSTVELERQEAAAERRRLFWLIASFVLTIPVFLFGMGFVDSPYSGYIQLVLTTCIMALPGRQFYVTAYKLLRARSANMDTLVSLGTGAAWFYSVVGVYLGHHHFYFESAAVIINFSKKRRNFPLRLRSVSWRNCSPIPPANFPKTAAG
jgi:cation transport ATPase